MKPTEAYFTHPVTHLQAEMQWLDLLLHREILRLRARYQLSFDEFRGLYVSDEQVDALVNQKQQESLSEHDIAESIQQITNQAEQLRLQCRQTRHAAPELNAVSQEFGLSVPEQEILLLALASELHSKYETLFACLNNDIQRKYLTVELALRVLAPPGIEGLHWRGLLRAEARLFSSGLLRQVTVNERQSSLHASISPHPLLVRVLLGFGIADGTGYRIKPPAAQRDGLWQTLPCAPQLRQRLQQWAVHVQQQLHADLGVALPVAVLAGPAGNGAAEVVSVLAASWQRPLVHLDLRLPLATGETFSSRIHAARFAQRLSGAVLHIVGLEMLLDQEQKFHPEGITLSKALAQERHLPVLVQAASLAQWQHLFPQQRCLIFQFTDPDYAQRLMLWEQSLNTIFAGSQPVELPKDALSIVADRFYLTAQQIHAASQALADHAQSGSEDVAEIGKLDTVQLMSAAREQSNQPLDRLAQRVASRFDWPDLILPGNAKQRLQEITSAIRNRQTVLGQWGFDKHQSNHGLKALFAGPSGTGKTMAASIIARELGLELFKIDLSQLVSKYIGETEKNLDKIFRAAQQANAILFFDEADALFGKRSEVKDAHDRYANIEVSYLLQKMEDPDFTGVVLLATNLARNIDDAFARRINYMVEFPQPDPDSRLRLWRAMIPAQAPLAADVDLYFLAQQFNLAGGDIRNVILESAFLAAQQQQKISMKHIIQCMSRQMMKQGRVPTASDFKQHLASIDDA